MARSAWRRSAIWNSSGGPANGDVRHRLNVNAQQPDRQEPAARHQRSTRASATPYTIRTGRDDNGDLVFNDRPAGVGRNTERGAARSTST